MGMLEKILAKLAQAKGPMKCPGCGERTGRVMAGEKVVTCEACGYRGSLTEWMMRGFDQERSGEAADPDRPPEGTRITRRVEERVEVEHAPGRPVLSMPTGRAFTVDLPPPRGAGRWAGLLVGFLIVGGFIAVGVFLMRDAGFFRVIWLGFNSIIALAMIAGAVSTVRNAGVVIRVSGDRGEIRVQRMKSRRVISEKRIPREGVEVRSYSSGRSNQTPMKRVELVGPQETLPVVHWRAENEVDPFVGELRRHLGG